MAEYASRYPDPSLRLLIEAVTQDTKENVLPPNFEDRARAASERLDRGEKDVESALQEVLEGLTKPSVTELAMSCLGNLCLAGQHYPAFQEQMAPVCDALVGALAGRLKPLDWRLCGRAAGAVCNVLPLGDCYVNAVREKCVAPLVNTL